IILSCLFPTVKTQSQVQPHLRTQQAARIPLLDGLLNRGKLASRLSAESVTSAVQMLLRLLVELPEPVRRSADIVEFFSARRPPRPPQPPTVAHSRASSDSAAAKPGLMLQFQSLTVGSVGYTGEGTAVYPACHYGQDYQSKLLTWLKTHRMHKYFDRLRKYSFEQLLAIDRPTLEALEFTQGAIKKLLGMLERVRQDRQAFDCPSRSSGSPCSSGACSEEELQMHGLLRSPPQQQHQAMLRKQQMVQQQQQQQLPLPLQPPMPPHLQHPQQLKQQQQQQQQQQ
uniref:SAM domain-containing protein n=1 Tax=Macrostomum lignano TaxID=282301 RepID=A0A1I8GFT3_9PLAT